MPVGPATTETGWTGQMIDELKALCRDGRSFGQIAKIISSKYRPITRSAAIGKATRLKLTGGASGITRRPKPRVRTSVPEAPKRREPKPTSPLKELQQSAEAVALSIEDEPIPADQRHGILRRNAQGDLEADPDLSNNACRWPIGDVGTSDFHFCCRDKVAGTSYCAQHARRAYVPVAPKRRKPVSVHEFTEKETHDRGMAEAGV